MFHRYFIEGSGYREPQLSQSIHATKGQEIPMGTIKTSLEKCLAGAWFHGGQGLDPFLLGQILISVPCVTRVHMLNLIVKEGALYNKDQFTAACKNQSPRRQVPQERDSVFLYIYRATR